MNHNRRDGAGEFSAQLDCPEYMGNEARWSLKKWFLDEPIGKAEAIISGPAFEKKK